MSILSYLGRNAFWIWMPILFACITPFMVIQSIDVENQYEKQLQTYHDSMNDCSKLKQFILDNYGSRLYNQAYSRYGVMCK